MESEASEHTADIEPHTSFTVLPVVAEQWTIVAWLWQPHPKTGEDAPIGFAVIKGLTGDRRSIEGFWVAPVVRREGVGSLFAQQILARHEGPWTIAFQHENTDAAVFWRKVANNVFGVGNWLEEERPVPGLP